MKKGFNLTDVLITLIIVGVLFMLTVPVLNGSMEDKSTVSEFYDFNSKLETAVSKWKASIGCVSSVKTCLVMQKALFNTTPDFSQISKYLNVVEKIDKGASILYWLPVRTLDYYGNAVSDYDFRKNVNRSRYLLADGKIISVETNDDGFWILVDVNGKKLPNRIGKDVFHIIVGYSPSKDISYFAREKTKDGICGPDFAKTPVLVCDPENVNPKIGNGANPATYVIVHHALPDYKELSQKVEGFRP